MENKNIIIAIIAFLVLVALGTAYYFYPKPEGKMLDVETVQVQTSYSPVAPLENKPDLNPVSKTNPFKDIKTNPFE